MKTIKYTVKIRRGLAHVAGLATADSATRNMRIDKFTPDQKSDKDAALEWIDQETNTPGESECPSDPSPATPKSDKPLIASKSAPKARSTGSGSGKSKKSPTSATPPPVEDGPSNSPSSDTTPEPDFSVEALAGNG